MEEDSDLRCLLGVLSTLGAISRAMHPGRLKALIETLGEQDARLTVDAARSEGQVALAASLAVQACAGLRAAPQADNPMMQAYRAMRQYSRSLEVLAALAETVPAVGRYFLEPSRRNDPTLMRRLAQPPHPELWRLPFRQPDRSARRIFGVCPTVVRSIQAHAADCGAARRFRSRAPVPVELAAGGQVAMPYRCRAHRDRQHLVFDGTRNRQSEPAGQS